MARWYKSYWEKNYMPEWFHPERLGTKPKPSQVNRQNVNEIFDPTYRDPKITPHEKWVPVTYETKKLRDERRKQYEDIAWDLLNLGSSVALPSRGMGKGVKGAIRILGNNRYRNRGTRRPYARPNSPTGKYNRQYGRTNKKTASYRKK